MQDSQNPSVNTLLRLPSPICATVDTIPNIEGPNVDIYCHSFAQIFWHPLGLYDLVLEQSETVENIHTYIHAVFVTYLSLIQ